LLDIFCHQIFIKNVNYYVTMIFLRLGGNIRMGRTVNEALTDLVAELGAACGKDEGEFHTNIGASLSMTMVGRPQDLQRHPGAIDDGRGGVYIKLGGDAQPEAARVLDHIIGIALQKVSAPAQYEGRRKVTPDAKGTGRAITFMVPAEKAEAFIGEVDRMVQRIVHSSRLKHECHKGVQFSLEAVNRIEGAKPFVQLEMPEDQTQRPYFQLHIQGTPDPLAETLAKALGKSGKETFPISYERGDRARKGKFKGGRDVDIPLNQEVANQALAAIREYADRVGSRVRQLPPGQLDLPS
jgi:hypothetical protein